MTFHDGSPTLFTKTLTLKPHQASPLLLTIYGCQLSYTVDTGSATIVEITQKCCKDSLRSRLTKRDCTNPAEPAVAWLALDEIDTQWLDNYGHAVIHTAMPVPQLCSTGTLKQTQFFAFYAQTECKIILKAMLLDVGKDTYPHCAILEFASSKDVGEVIKRNLLNAPWQQAT